MIGCLRTRVRKQRIIALYFEFDTVVKFYNLGARCLVTKCSVALPHGAVGWSAVCDCGITSSYSLFALNFM